MYKSGQREGYMYRLNANGTISEKLPFHKGKLHGVCEYYTSKGIIYRTEISAKALLQLFVAREKVPIQTVFRHLWVLSNLTILQFCY